MPEVLPSIKRVSTKDTDVKLPKFILKEKSRNSSEFSDGGRITTKRVNFQNATNKSSKFSKSSHKSIGSIDKQEMSFEHQENEIEELPGFNKIKPVRKRLTAQEQRKIFSCYDEAITNLEVITSVVIVLFHKKNSFFYERFKTEVGDHMNENLVKLKKYCEEVDHFYLKNPNTGDPYLDWFEVKVSEKVRNLTRMLVHDDVSREKVLAFLPEKINAGGLGRKLYQPKKLIKAFKDLREILYERFLTTAIEKKRHLKYINSVQKTNYIYQERCENLQEELQAATKTKIKTTADNEKLILRLKVSIHEVLEFHKNEIEGMNKELNKKKMTDLKAHMMKIAKLNEQLKHKKKNLATLTEKNRQKESTLKKRNFKVKSEIERLIDTYDEEMNQLQVQIDRISKDYKVEKQQLEEVETSFYKTALEYKEVQDRIEREKKEEEEERLRREKRLSAAVVIQSHFRKYLVKKRLRAAHMKHVREMRRARRRNKMKNRPLYRQKKLN